MSFTANRPLWALAPLCLLVQNVWAQEVSPSSSPAEVAVPNVVVKGAGKRDRSTLTQPDLPTARRRIESTPGGAGIVDPKNYEQGRVSTVADALGDATGVFVQPRFGAEEARISIRGSGLQRTFHGRGIKLMQDGVPLNLADGSFDFQAVEALAAQYVEVWRGANALQYGATTLGGAVNFVSPNGRNADRMRLRAEAGSFGYSRLHASTGDQVGDFDYYLSASGFDQDGFRDHSKQTTGRLFANLGYQINADVATRFYAGYVHSDSELPGSLTRAQAEADPTRPNPANVSGDQQRNIRWSRLSNKTVVRNGPQRLELFAYVSAKELFHPIFQVIEQTNRDLGAEARYVRDDEWAGQANRLTLGIAPSRGTTDENRFVNVGGNAGAQTASNRQMAFNWTFYAEDQYRFRPDLALVLGLQHLHAQRRQDDRLVTGPGANNFDLRYHHTSPKLGVLYDLNASTQVFANWSRSVEPPSMSELTGGATPVLNDAQKANTVEVGTRGRLNSLQWDVALYETRLRDELLQISTTPGVTTAVNADKTRHRGLELGLSGQAFENAAGRLEWRASALWNDFRFQDDATYGNRQLPGMPRTFAKAQVGYRWANGTAAALTAEGSSGYPIDFANSLRAGGYGIWGVRLSGEVSKGLNWFLDGRNLSDRHYVATTGVVRDAAGLDVPQFLPGDGRAVYAGLDWRFN